MSSLIDELSELSKLKLSKSEKEQLSKDITEILNYFQKILTVKIEKIEKTLDLSEDFKKDIPERSNIDVLDTYKEKDNENRIKVPKTNI